MSSSVQEVQGNAFEPQELAVLAIIHADDHQRELKRGGAAVEQAPGGLGDVDAMVARRVVAARPQVELARLVRRQLAVPRPADARAVAEHRQVTRVMRVFYGGLG